GTSTARPYFPPLRRAPAERNRQTLQNMPPSREQPAAAAAADGGVEENVMAILDSFVGIKDSRDLHDDRAAFLEAVRSVGLAGDKPMIPTEYGTHRS
uniref:Uncharacterized protein n=1 Tax=Aegilops tauschii subsp. strangulata TaxID=200361 RepID=A0A453P134_AEGTS